MTDSTIKNIIFDTDAGSDCDDMMALGYLLQAQKENKIRVNAVTYSHASPHGAAAIRATFRYFGEKAPSVGVMVDGNPFDDNYVKWIDEHFATSDDRLPAEPAATVLRRALAEAEGKTVICAVGPLTNIAALLNSAPDEISTLNGVELVSEKCERMVLMAGRFIPDGSGSIPAEWNVKCDILAARAVAEISPVPLAWLPHETGIDMITGKAMKERYGMESPISASFFLFPDAKDGRHSWDPATALYTVEGCGELFTECHGRVSIDENGVSVLAENKMGESCVIYPNIANCDTKAAKGKIAAYLDSVVMGLHEKCGGR